jgi:hypothetical protein
VLLPKPRLPQGDQSLQQKQSPHQKPRLPNPGRAISGNILTQLKNKQYEACLQILEQPVEKKEINNKLEAQKWFMKALCHESNENKTNCIECYM